MITLLPNGWLVREAENLSGFPAAKDRGRPSGLGWAARPGASRATLDGVGLGGRRCLGLFGKCTFVSLTVIATSSVRATWKTNAAGPVGASGGWRFQTCAFNRAD